MLSELQTELNETVRHHAQPRRDIHGKATPGTFAEYPARVMRTEGTIRANFAGSDQSNLTATIWLIEHPVAVSIGHYFSIDKNGQFGEPQEVAGIETRSAGGTTLTKVHLK